MSLNNFHAYKIKYIANGSIGIAQLKREWTADDMEEVERLKREQERQDAFDASELLRKQDESSEGDTCKTAGVAGALVIFELPKKEDAKNNDSPTNEKQQAADAGGRMV